MHMMPSLRYGFKDQNTRYRKRYLDLIFNPEARPFSGVLPSA